MIHAEGNRARYKLHEPNPRRTADIVARHLDYLPHYLSCDTASVAIAPPDARSDQRLLRGAGRERAVERIAPGRDAMFRFPLVEGCDAQLAREMASPRYASVPDLLPIPFDDGAARSLSYGRLDPANRVWILPPHEAHRLAIDLTGPGRFAAFYRLELHAALGSPSWIGALIDGKMSACRPARPPACVRCCTPAATPRP